MANKNTARLARQDRKAEQDDRLAAVDAAAKSDRPLFKQFSASIDNKSVDETSRTVRFVITTGGVDRDNDTIDPRGWDLKDFLRSPSVLWAHDYGHLPVARALDVVQTADGLESTAQFPPKGVYHFADTVFDLIRLGMLNACSVGFKPIEYARDEVRGGINFLRQSLLEWSVVPVPANAEALVTAKAAGIDVLPVVAWAKGVMDASTPADIAAVVKMLAAKGTQPDYDQSGDEATNVPPNGDGTCPDGYERQGGVCVPKAAKEPKGAAGMQECPKCQQMSFDGQSCSECGYDSTKIVPPPGEADDDTCPACGATYDGEVCGECGWLSPDADPMGAPVASYCEPGMVKALRALHHEPAFVTLTAKGERFRTYRSEDDDPIRWNRQLSKAFDVAGEPLEPSRLEIAWVSRFIEVPVQQLSVETFYVPSARMGSFLSAFDECVAAWKVHAQRNMTESGREVPPEYETLQLNSRTTRSFMVEGMRFMERSSDNAKIVSKIQRAWSGLYVTQYSRHEQAEVRSEFTNIVWERAAQLNYLKGEAFTLSGEFLDRGNLDWPDLFLPEAKEAVLRRTVDRINEQGEDMESRGLMMMGPPGTGKTLTGRVMMAQADTTYIWISARDFYRSGAFGAFTYAFDLAAECAPSILFFEDVDSYICGNDTIDLLKTEMDGLKRRKGVQTILTTNFPELIPDALIDRPGRFHDLLELALPTAEVRTRMLAAWLPATTSDERAAIATETEGFSGAHLRELVNFAATLQKEEQLATGAALTRALEKLQEQRALVEALRQAPDYRPRRQVRAAVGTALEQVRKRGRVLSAANESKLRQAREHLDGVLAKLDAQPAQDAEGDAAAAATDGEPKAAEGFVLVLAEEPEPVEVPVLRLALEPDEPDMISLDGVKEAIRSAVGQVLAGVVREETTAALARARGRVD
jgi:HK97 family phage prohead protease